MRLAFIVGMLAILSLVLTEHRPTNAGLPLVNADYQQCVTINPGLLKPPPPRLTGDTRQKEIA